jgi:hypothetical protein
LPVPPVGQLRQSYCMHAYILHSVAHSRRLISQYSREPHSCQPPAWCVPLPAPAPLPTALINAPVAATPGIV